jgi:hypothetical protein
MILPPLIARVRVRSGAFRIRLWVPLFLLWLLLLVLLAPVLLVAAVVALFAPARWRFGPAARGACLALCETRGTCVDVESARRRVFIALH